MHMRKVLTQICNKTKSFAHYGFKSDSYTFTSLFTNKTFSGFTLAEVLITLGIIGVVAAMTIPTLIQNSQNRELAAGVLKFNSNLQQAVMLWKVNEGCTSDTTNCILSMGLVNDDPSFLEQTIGPYMSIMDKASGATNTADWLPADTLNYYGQTTTTSYGKVARKGSRNSVYLLKDGMTLSFDAGTTSAAIYVDVNGKKSPNRVGKDVFQFSIGGFHGKDIYYGALFPFSSSVNTEGLCAWGLGGTTNCDTDNVDPTVGNGANPTEYVILHRELPDYGALSQTVTGFAP